MKALRLALLALWISCQALAADGGTVGPPSADSGGTVGPLSADRGGTVGPLSADHGGTVGPLSADTGGTVRPPSADSGGTVGPLSADSGGTVGPRSADGGRGAPSRGSGWDRYRILVERNIFAKDRVRYRPRSMDQDRDEMGPPAPKGETENVLVGIVERDGRLVAFVENSRTGAVQIVRTNDAIAHGKVAAITQDSIEYMCGDSSVIVNLGKNLEGGGSAALGEPAKAQAASSNGAAVSPAMNAVLELMRKRRQEAMK